MKKINLAIGVHNHQPVGNFDFIFEEAFQKSYDPFLRLLEQFPDLKITMHYSGILLEWMAAHHEAFIERLRVLTGRGQVECMSGGYYEPILITIPDVDKIAQIRKLTDYLERQIGVRPCGAWLAERVWEPDLPQPLMQAGMAYTVVDDIHFKSAGLRDDQLYGYYLTEHLGSALRIFPVSERLRHAIPFRPPEEVLEYLHGLATEEGDRLLVFADDGEKFGVWPDTYEQCYEKGWLESFFRLLRENRDWLRLVTFREALQNMAPRGRVYLPAASYREMMEWSMPARTIRKYEAFAQWQVEHRLPAEYRSFINVGFWRNFLAKYPEANHMHKRMLRSSRRLQAWRGKETQPLTEAREHLYASQCNCPYWHGVFGGLYLPNLRYPIYKNLIAADCAMDRATRSAAQHRTGWVTAEAVDFDSDGHEEVIVETDRLNLIFSPRYGGALYELDLKEKAVNLLDILSRREEGYHHRLGNRMRTALPDLPADASTPGSTALQQLTAAREENLQAYLHYDWYRHGALIDHFLHPATQLQQFASAEYGEQGDFVDQPYTVQMAKNRQGMVITLAREGHVWMGADFVPVMVQKQIILKRQSSVIAVDYTLVNRHVQSVDLWFGSECAIALLAGDAEDRFYHAQESPVVPRHLASTGTLEHIHELGLRDEWNGIDVLLSTDRAAVFWRFPIETVSLSEAGFERNYQCSIVMPHWRFHLAPGQSWRVKLQIAANVIK